MTWKALKFGLGLVVGIGVAYLLFWVALIGGVFLIAYGVEEPATVAGWAFGVALFIGGGYAWRAWAARHSS
jgi:hypothetical protein